MASPSWLMHLQARARGEVAGFFDPNTPMEQRGAQPTPLAPTPTGELAHPDTIADSQAAGVDVVVLAPVQEDRTPPAVPTTLAGDSRADELMAQVEKLLAEVREQRAAAPAEPTSPAPIEASAGEVPAALPADVEHTGFVSPLETGVDPSSQPPAVA